MFMRYDLTVPLHNLNNVQITDAEAPEGYTLRTVLTRCALHVARGKTPGAAEKLQAYALAKRIAMANAFIDLSAEEVAFLKEQAGAMWTPLVMGQVWEMLEAPVTLDNSYRREQMAADVLNRGFGEKPTADIPLRD
jgi:hypothetical protein